jgi:hypothetical protein
MKKYIFLYLLISSVCIIKAQTIGELAPEKPAEVFPPNAIGGDLMFCDGGMGLGAFYRKQIGGDFTFFSDLSFSESKDEKEIEYYDYYGNPYTIGKKNRVFLVPLNFGLQYRLFKESISDNLRPYINFGVGPAMAVTTPYDMEFFSSFGKAQKKFAAGGYIGLGANFGLDKSALIGFNIRYYYVGFFDQGVESLEGRYNKNIGGFYITINIGKMY